MTRSLYCSEEWKDLTPMRDIRGMATCLRAFMGTVPIMRLRLKVRKTSVSLSADMMWGSCARNVEITELGLSYECISFADKDKVEWIESSEHVITLYPAELICTYTYEVRNVKNMEYMTQACGSLSSMAPSMLFANEELDRECVTVPFETELHPESSKMTGKFIRSVIMKRMPVRTK